ncbi:MAG TPA: gamma-glutamyl-gamma-aminobutyrate hydrolase family protein [Myxococcales bacterium LLY-WYZ-16_1]|nr:gamma-glutamyl-gamma-aminobutyrate hydrolase family protein [Myxococcales bacterium LLY-WYZ-16_1]
MPLPRILITTDLDTTWRRDVPFSVWSLKQAVARAVEAAGALPWPVGPQPEDRDERIAARAASFAAEVHGVVVSGGAFDIPPAWSGARPGGRLDGPKPARTRFEWSVLDAAHRRGLPVLGLCGGMQLLAVWAGGGLLGDLQAERGVDHEQPDSPRSPSHSVELTQGTWLSRRAAAGSLRVNSSHHQAVDRMPPEWRILGRAPDGTIEAIDDGRGWWCGVQWHPELLEGGPAAEAPFSQLVSAARRDGSGHEDPGDRSRSGPPRSGRS